MITFNDFIDLTTTQKVMLYDNSCKQIISQKQILARIVSSFVKEAAHLTLEQIENIIDEVRVSDYPVEPHYHLRELNNESNILGEGILYYDIRFLLDIPSDDMEVRVYLDIEIQNDSYPGYPIVSRGIVYNSRMISQQNGEEYNGQNYGGVKKVYSIWIMPQAAKYMDGVVNTYGIEERRLQKNYHDDIENYDKMCIILIYLSTMHELFDTYEHFDSVLTPLTLLLSNHIADPNKKKEVLEKQYGFQLTNETEKEMNTMGSLGMGLIMETARRVEKEVTEEMTIKHLEKLIASGMSPTQAFDILDIPEEKRESLIKALSV